MKLPLTLVSRTGRHWSPPPHPEADWSWELLGTRTYRSVQMSPHHPGPSLPFPSPLSLRWWKAYRSQCLQTHTVKKMIFPFKMNLVPTLIIQPWKYVIKWPLLCSLSKKDSSLSSLLSPSASGRVEISAENSNNCKNSSNHIHLCWSF